MAAAVVLGPRPTGAQDDAVDVLLVLAVDVSRSIDEDEARLQREGYRNAIAHPRMVEAVRGGVVGAIGLAYVEWAGIEHQRLVIPWTRIASQADADDWAAALGRAPRQSLSWTSVSGGIEFSRLVLAEAPWQAARRVIDVSGDGVNNSGPSVEETRDHAVAEGITTNGLPIVNDRPTFGRLPANKTAAASRGGSDACGASRTSPPPSASAEAMASCATSSAPAPATTSMSQPNAAACSTSVVQPLRSQSSEPRSLNPSCSSRRQVWRERRQNRPVEARGNAVAPLGPPQDGQAIAVSSTQSIRQAAAPLQPGLVLPPVPDAVAASGVVLLTSGAARGACSSRTW
jgi:hypothetical protein